MRVHHHMRSVVAVAALGLVATIGGTSSAAAVQAPEPALRAQASALPAVKGVVSNYYLGEGAVTGNKMGPGMVAWFTTVYNGSVHWAGLDAALQAKVNSTAGKVTKLEADSPYPGATQLSDHPGQGANSTAKFVGDSGATLQRAWVMCAEGKTAIGGGFQRADEGVAAFKNLQVVTSAATQIKAGAEVYEPIAGDAAGSVKPNAWLVEGFNNGTTDLIVRPSVICAQIG